MKPELVTAAETYRFVKISPRKRIKRAFGLYALSTQGREIGRAVRRGYLFMRHIDDVVDGDRTDVNDPVSYVLDLKNQVQTGTFRRDTNISELAKQSLEFLDKVKRPADNPRQDFIDGIDAMLFDQMRANIRRALDRDELEKHLELTISPGLNILLTGISSSLRAPDISGFSRGLARVYSVRDLDEDWENGIINIPREVLEEAGINSHTPLDSVRKHQVIDSYLKSSLEKGKQELSQVKFDPRLRAEKLTFRIINGFIKSAMKVEFESSS